MSHGALHGTACKGCRRRGRKCDRTLPTCLSCKRRGVDCEGYITRWPGVAARGKLAGKSSPAIDSVIATSKNNPTRARHAQSAIAGSSDPEYSTSINVSRQPAGGSSLLDTLSSTRDDDLERLIKHYMEDLSSIFYLGNKLSHNPMFQYVLPLVGSVPPVRYAIAASASCHIAARTSDEALEQKSLYLRVRATHLLRERLKDPGLATDQTTLASILMMAQLDMCSGDCIEFETHLKAAVAIIRDGQIDHAANRFYFEQRLAWLDIISSTTSTRLPYFSVKEFKTALGRFSSGGDREWSYDVFPCPVDLCEMLGNITVLYKTQSDGDSLSEEGLEQANCMMSRLDKWKFSQNCFGPREHMVEAWRLGIMAYLRRLFPTVDHWADTVTLTSRVLYHAELIPPETSWSYSLLWPIFQVGVALSDVALEEKAWIRRRLKLALGAVGCRHFSNALETLQFVWDNHAQHSSPTGTFGRTIMLG